MSDFFETVRIDDRDDILNIVRKRIRDGKRWEGPIIQELSEEFCISPENMFEFGEKIYKKFEDEFDAVNGAPLKKVEAFLSDRFQFRRNAITKRVMYRPAGSQDLYEPCQFNNIWRLLQHNLKDIGGKIKIPIGDVQNLLESNYVEEYNPIKEYFHRRKGWDGKDHITALASHIHTTDQKFWEEQFKKCLVRMIACSVDLIENRIVMVLVQPRQESGKCLGKGTKVMMSDFSIKKVEDIRVGDQVMGPDGKPRNVLETHSGIDQMYWVRQSRGMDYRVNSNHILSLKRRKNRPWQGRIVNIHLNQYLATTKTHRFNLMGWKAKFDFPETSLPLDPYYVGLWLGDGHSRNNTIETGDKEVIEWLDNFAIQNGMFLTTTKTNKGSQGYRIVAAKGSGNSYHKINKITNALHELNLIKNKHIPDAYLYNSRDNRLKLLAGLLDSDGSLSKHHPYFEITLKDEKLSDQVRFLAKSLGFRANTNIKKATIKSINFSCEVYRTGINGEVSEIPTKIKRKQAPIKKHKPRPSDLDSISIEKDIIDEYYGFSTDGDHLFLLEDFTVTHNSNFLRFLCPPELREYYKEDPVTVNKDSEISLTENFIWNMEELEALDRKEITSLKSFISRNVSKQRRAYARQEETRPRIVNFWGSTNKDQFLNDVQNTRWLCFRVNEIDWNYNNYATNVKNIDINKVWDQAWHLYRTGFNYRLDTDEATKRDSINHSFESMGNEKQLIIKYLTKVKANSVSGEFNMIIDIVQYLQAATLYKIQVHAFNVQTAMMQLGFVSETRTINGNPVKGFWVMKKMLTNGAQLPMADNGAPLKDENELPF